MAYGCTITVGTGKIPRSQSNFVWLATEDNFPSAAIDGGGTSILNGGGNLRCYTDDTKATQLPIEVVTFVTGGTPSVQVRGLSPTLAVASTVYIEADSVATTQPAVTDTYGRNAVWVDREYQYNFKDSSSIIDSKGVTAPSVIGTLTDDTTAPIGSGVSFGTSGINYVNLGQNVGDTVGDITLRAWVKPLASTAFGTIHSIRSGASWSYQQRLESLDQAILIGSASPNSPRGPFSVGAWYQLVLTISGTTITYYSDGFSDGTSSVTGSRSLNPTVNAAIGNFVSGGNNATNVNASLAEVSVEFGAISSGTVEAEYNNQSDSATFWTTSAWAEQSSGISVTEQTNNSNYTANSPAITLTGSISITESVSNTSYASVNPAIVLTGVISIAEQAKNTTYTSLDPIIDLTGLVEITESTVNTSYNIQSPTITLTSGAIEITEAAAGTQYNPTNPSILLTPEPLGIVSTVCFNGTITEATFNGVNVDLSYTGKQQDIVFNGNFNDLQFNGTIQTTCNTGSIKTNC